MWCENHGKMHIGIGGDIKKPNGASGKELLVLIDHRGWRGGGGSAKRRESVRGVNQEKLGIAKAMGNAHIRTVNGQQTLDCKGFLVYQSRISLLFSPPPFESCSPISQGGKVDSRWFPHLLHSRLNFSCCN